MTAVFASIFFTTVLGGAAASLLASLDEARRVLFADLAPADPMVAPRRRVRVSLRSRAVPLQPLRAAA